MSLPTDRRAVSFPRLNPEDSSAFQYRMAGSSLPLFPPGSQPLYLLDQAAQRRLIKGSQTNPNAEQNPHLASHFGRGKRHRCFGPHIVCEIFHKGPPKEPSCARLWTLGGRKGESGMVHDASMWHVWRVPLSSSTGHMARFQNTFPKRCRQGPLP